MEFYIATNIQFVLQTKRRFMSFSPILILLNHTDNIVLWFWHKLNFDFCVPWFTIEHISEEGWINGNMYWRVYYAPSFSDICTPISSMLFWISQLRNSYLIFLHEYKHLLRSGPMYQETDAHFSADHFWQISDCNMFEL